MEFGIALSDGAAGWRARTLWSLWRRVWALDSWSGSVFKAPRNLEPVAAAK